MSKRTRATAPAKKAPDLLAEHLRERILRGEIPPATPLREEDLAHTHKLSRHTVRSALAALASERLVENEPYRGARVRSFSEADAVALQHLRAALESEAVRMLHEQYGDTWPEHIRRPIVGAIDALAQTETEGDWLATTRAHSAMHIALVEAAGSSRISEAYRLLDSETLLLVTQLRINYPEGSLDPEHRSYFALVQTGDTDAVRKHLFRTIELMRQSNAQQLATSDRAKG